MRKGPQRRFWSGNYASALFIYSEVVAISKQNLINEEIRAREVRLIAADGTQVGIVPIKEALALAAEANLDLVNISPNAAPPVCKMMDYGKYRYDQQKREKEARKKQKVMELKEVRLGVFIEEHDLATKAKLANKFLEAGDKVKVNMRFRGREMGYVDKGKETMLGFAAEFAQIGNIERAPTLEGRNLSMIIAPKTEREKEKLAKAMKAESEIQKGDAEK